MRPIANMESRWMRYLLFRVWGVAVGLVMILLSLALQTLVFLIIAGLTIPLFLPTFDPRISFLILILLFNGVSCYEYFRKRRVVTLGGVVHQMAGLVTPDASHASMAIFLVPRGIDRIISGTEIAEAGHQPSIAAGEHEIPLNARRHDS